MTRTKTVFLTVAVLLASALAAYMFFRPQEEKIRKQLKLLSELISKEPEEKNLKMIYKIQAISSLFYSQCDIELPKSPWNGSYTPEEISSNLARGRTQFKTLQLGIYDVRIEKLESGFARAIFTARLAAKSDSNSIDEVREIESTLLLHDGKWLFASFKSVDILEK